MMRSVDELLLVFVFRELEVASASSAPRRRRSIPGDAGFRGSSSSRSTKDERS